MTQENKKKHRIKVSIADAPTRSAVLINPKDGSVMAEGSTGTQLAKRIYGRR